MLCPLCGAEVGETVQLCSDCEAQKKERVDVEERARQMEAGEIPAAEEQDLPEIAPTDADDSPKKTLRLAFAGLAIFAFLVAGKVLWRNFSQPPHPTQPAPQTGESSSVFSGAASLPAPSYAGHVRGGIRVDRYEIRFSTVLASYHRANRTLEVAFFQTADQPIDDQAVRKLSTLENFKGERPDAVLTLSFPPGQPSCAMSALEEYQLTVFRNDQRLPLLGDRISAPVKTLGGTLASGVTNAIETLGCSFEDGGKIAGSFRGSRQYSVKDETQSLSWELDFDTPLIGPKSSSDLTFDSNQAKAAMALWNAGKNEVTVGFFGEELSIAERERIRRSGSFEANAEKKPDVTLIFTLPPGEKELKQEKIKTFGVLFYRGRTEGFDFPGIENSVGAFYVGNTKSAGSLEGLSGGLSDQGDIAGRYSNSAVKKIGATEVRMRWNLAFHTTVFDILARSDAALEDTGTRAAPTPQVLSDSGSISSDDVEVKVASVVPLYYPQSGDLVVGFYSDELTPDERAEIIRRKALATYVDGKRPTMILTLDFPEDQAEAKIAELRGYSMFFYREGGGAFHFPGSLDVVSLRKNLEQIPPEESISVSGSLLAGGKVRISLKGSGKVAGNAAEFRWLLNYDLEPVIIR